MYIAYFDECGDDGYPEYSSELFILTSVYFHHLYWKKGFELIHQFRKNLRDRYGFPVKTEFHTREFVTNKDPYHGKYTSSVRREILFAFCELVPQLEISVVNVVIDKSKIKTKDYNVLENALKYNVQRIENDLNKKKGEDRFIIITDEGRVSKMRATTRAIQKFNFIPSNFSNSAYRRDIGRLIEDPLPKPSSESYFIQLADTISFVVSLYSKRQMCSPAVPWAKRVRDVLQDGDEILLMEKIKPRLNTKASRSNSFGIVCYPK